MGLSRPSPVGCAEMISIAGGPARVCAASGRLVNLLAGPPQVVLAGLVNARGRETVIVTLSCLIIDDSEKFLASATRLLSLQGVSVIGRASTGDEGLRLAAALRPDVTLVEVELGDEDGLELARRLTSGDPAARGIFI